MLRDSFHSFELTQEEFAKVAVRDAVLTAFDAFVVQCTLRDVGSKLTPDCANALVVRFAFRVAQDLEAWMGAKKVITDSFAVELSMCVCVCTHLSPTTGKLRLFSHPLSCYMSDNTQACKDVRVMHVYMFVLLCVRFPYACA